MMRALKFVSAAFAAAMVMANGQTAFAQMNTYELGPFTVSGSTQSEANGEMYDFIDDIVSTLPEGHEYLGFEVETSGWINPLTYEIQFVVTIWIPSPPGPPQGGGGGGNL